MDFQHRAGPTSVRHSFPQADCAATINVAGSPTSILAGRGCPATPIEGSDEARLAFKVAWCNGAPGIGLARLAGRHVFESAAVRRDIDAALTTTCQSHLLSRDHICCGNLGLVETLLVAGVALSQPEWTNESVRMASRTAGRAKRKGSFGITFGNGFFNPTLFQGAAGVDYEFLRLACPDKITSVLVLE